MLKKKKKKNKHPLLTKFECLVSSRSKKVTKEIGQGVGRGNIELSWREEKGGPHKITRPIYTPFNASDGTCLSSTNLKYEGNFIKGLGKK